MAESNAGRTRRKARQVIQLAAILAMAARPAAMPVGAAPHTGPPLPAHQRVWLFMSIRDTSLVCPSTVRDEIVRIWRLNGVEIVYPRSQSGGSSPEQSPRSAVAFILGSVEDLPAQFRSKVSPLAFGATLSNEGVPLPVAYAFVDRALRLVRHAQRDASGLQKLRLSLLLGRIVAHEMGHILLRSGSHSDRGLMRPTFDYLDLMPGCDGAYVLDARDHTAIRAFLSVAAQEDAGNPAGVPSPK